jgi:predicted dehydrogenase
MGLSHLSIVRSHPDVNLVGVCDSAGYVLDVLGKYTGLVTYRDYVTMLDTARPAAVLIATPTHLHASMVRAALERNIHVFCEKPLTLSPEDSEELVTLAAQRGLVTQVGYHNRYVASFAEVKRLLDAGAIGRVSHASAESYGPVVVKSQSSTWRSRRAMGGGCLYDYAAHPIDLLTWYFGPVDGVSGSALGRTFSADTEDQVHSTLRFGDVIAQLAVDWSDASQRKMTTSVSIWGTEGNIRADRQVIEVYLRGDSPVEGYGQGWNVRHTTDLTSPVWFYLRGEEYSAQLDSFVRQVLAGRAEGGSSFASAQVDDDVIARIRVDADRSEETPEVAQPIGRLRRRVRRVPWSSRAFVRLWR